MPHTPTPTPTPSIAAAPARHSRRSRGALGASLTVLAALLASGLASGCAVAVKPRRGPDVVVRPARPAVVVHTPRRHAHVHVVRGHGHGHHHGH